MKPLEKSIRISESDNSNKHHSQKSFSPRPSFLLRDLFKDPKSNEYGQFAVMEPYPTNKLICDTKNFLRDTIEATELKLGKKAKNIQWIVKKICKNDQGDDRAIVGWRAEFV